MDGKAVVRSRVGVTHIRAILAETVGINEIVRLIFPNDHRDTDMNYSIRCHFHQDTKPSLRVDMVRNVLRCYGACARAFDPVGAYAIAKEISSAEAIADLANLFSVDLNIMTRAYKILGAHEPPTYDPGEIMSESFTDQIAIDYLLSRGIPEEITLQYGIRRWRNRLVLPHEYQGMLRSVDLRALDESFPKYLTYTSPLGDVPFGIDKVDFAGPVILCEAAIDAMSIASIGVRAISQRINSFTPSDLELLGRFPVVVTAFDGDQTGRQRAAQVKIWLPTVVENVVLPQGKDCNNLLMAGSLLPFLQASLRDIGARYAGMF